MNENSQIWPTEIKLKKDKKSLEVVFNNGERFSLSAEYLRVSSPSAEVQGHSPEQRRLEHGKVNVQILKVESVGNYAVKLTFDDMHNTGLYSWSYLYDLGSCYDKLWQSYLAELEENGLSRNI